MDKEKKGSHQRPTWDEYFMEVAHTLPSAPVVTVEEADV